MDKIKQLSSFLIKIFNLLLVIIPVWIAMQWVFIDWFPFIKGLVAEGILGSPIQTPEGAINLSQTKLNLLSRIVGLIGSTIGSLPLFLGLLILKGLFKNYQRGAIFVAENAQKYKYLGWLFFLEGLLIKSLSDMLVVLAVTLSNPPGHRFLTIGFGTPNLEDLFCGLLVIVISWIMAEGHKIQEDQQFTI
jgi:hypothetical protein